jgi:hypothetical protein
MIPETQALVFLHDSIMQSSEKLLGRSVGHAIITHMLMNDDSTVIVDRNSHQKELAIMHLKQLGLRVHQMTVFQHDTFIQDSQLPLFELLPLLPKLEKWASEGLLTPSAHDLLTVLHKRQASWSPMTLKSLKAHQSNRGVRYNESND